MIQQLSSSSATWVNRWEVSSLTSDHTYIVGQKSDGSFGCDCPAWKFKKAPRPDCKHILKVKAVEPMRPASPLLESSRPRTAPICEQPVAARTHETGRPIFLLQTRRSIRLED